MGAENPWYIPLRHAMVFSDNIKYITNIVSIYLLITMSYWNLVHFSKWDFYVTIFKLIPERKSILYLAGVYSKITCLRAPPCWLFKCIFESFCHYFIGSSGNLPTI